MDRLGIDVRRTGTAMLVFGIVGMVIAGIIAVGLISGAAAARNLDDRLAAEQARLVASLDRVNATMTQLVTTTDNASDTLATTSESLATASGVLGQVADTSTEIAGSIDINLLGSRPLAGAAAKFAQLSTDVRTFQDDADRLAANLAVNATDVRGLATELELLRAEIASITDRVTAFGATGEVVALVVGGILLVGLLVAWLAVAAAGCAWIGLRLRRLGASVATPAPGSAPPTAQEG